jgi:putative phosphoesterase
MRKRMIIGVISDTHGKLTEQTLEALKGCEVIFHAGDIGGPDVIQALEKIGTVYPVRGNTDRGIWAQRLPLTQMVELKGSTFYVLHDIGDLNIDLNTAEIDVVIYGHSHMPKKEKQGGVLYFNPGSAGPKRFRLPACMGKIKIVDGELITEWVDLD